MIFSILEIVIGVAAVVTAFSLNIGADKNIPRWVGRLVFTALGASLILLGSRALYFAH